MVPGVVDRNEEPSATLLRQALVGVFVRCRICVADAALMPAYGWGRGFVGRNEEPSATLLRQVLVGVFGVAGSALLTLP